MACVGDLFNALQEIEDREMEAAKKGKRSTRAVVTKIKNRCSLGGAPNIVAFRFAESLTAGPPGPRAETLYAAEFDDLLPVEVAWSNPRSFGVARNFSSTAWHTLLADTLTALTPEAQA